ncbi:hypothetical protein MJT46_011830 [Ovis ammon polii x Ovis aries]|nr:hypothetical protein MJT46_011830 [Ovis ammon polii x Ovis aries]
MKPERTPSNSDGDGPVLRPPERVPKVPVVLGPGIDGRGVREVPEELAWGLAFPEATRAGPCGPRRKEFPAFPSHLKRRRSPQERQEELQCRATIPRVPQMCQSIPEELIFPARPRRSYRGSTPTTVAIGTGLWESLVGKPRGKAIDPLIHAAECVTLLLPLWRKAHVHAPIRDED